jgi:hypothetical protein
VQGLLRRKSVNLLIGDSGLGKTPLAIQLGLSVASGANFLGKQVEPGTVLYCDAESDLPNFTETLGVIAKYLGLETRPEAFLTWSPNWDESNSVAEFSKGWDAKLFERVYVVKPALAIVDSLRMFFPAAEGGNEDATAVFKRMKQATKETATSWLLLHHRRKANQGGFIPKLEENPHVWCQEAAGAHAIVNQSDTRLGVVPHGGQGDLLLGGFVRGNGPLPGIDVGRVMSDTDDPIGYEVLTGVDLLSPEDRATYDALGPRFRFKDVASQMGGKSGSNPTRFLKRCISLRAIEREDLEYVKAGQPVV